MSGTNFPRQPMDPMLSKNSVLGSESKGNGIKQFDIVSYL
jgi:hypothetical protein